MSPDAGRSIISGGRRWVIKVGSALLTDNGRGLDQDMVAALARGMAELREDDREVVLVSSGAVAAGMSRSKSETCR